jgi:hypothetical protein
MKTTLNNDAQPFLALHVNIRQTMLVAACFDHDIFEAEHIINREHLEANNHEIYEWYVVSEWLARRLEAEGEAILRHAFGVWWGRTVTGQHIAMDTVIQRIIALYAPSVHSEERSGKHGLL